MMWLVQDDPAVDHVEQSDQSDLEFIQKLCKDNGYNLKVTSEQIIIYDEAQLETGEPKITFVRPGTPTSMEIYKMNITCRTPFERISSITDSTVR